MVQPFDGAPSSLEAKRHGGRSNLDPNFTENFVQSA